MTHVCERAFQAQIDTLRNADYSLELDHSARVHADLFCDLDPDIGSSRASFLSSPGKILALDAQIVGLPRWVVLRLELGQEAYQPGDVLGLVVRGAADHPLEIKPFLRMVRNGRLADTRFDDLIVLAKEPGVYTALHTLSAMDPACGEQGNCALVLGLPSRSARIQIDDLGFFVIPAAAGLRSTPLEFAAFSV